jgi:hypothetical protein
MAITDYSTTAASNTSISGINIAEGCSPAGINNAIRQLMADIAAGATVKTAAQTISGAWTYTASPILNDSVKLFLGTGSDMSLYHDGSNSFITNATGTLNVTADSFSVKNAANNETMATFVADGAATLFYNNAAKLATASGGITVTGDTGTTTLTATGAVSGATMAGAMIQDDDAFASPAANKVASSESILAMVIARIAGTETSVADLTNSGANDLTTYEFTSLPSGINTINVMLPNVKSSGGSFLIQLRVSSSFVTSGYVSGQTVEVGTELTSTAGFIMRATSAASRSGRGTLERLPGTNTWTFSGAIDRAAGGGHIALAGELTGVRVISTNGSDTFTGGQFALRYW